MWVFGYGSLAWKADFPFRRKLVGYIKGYVRRFYQLSEDHRGVPGKPGLVVTLLPSADQEEQVWGVAYEISKEDVAKVTAYLDHREKDGYAKNTVLFYPGISPRTDADDNSLKEEFLRPFELVIYVGLDTNPWYIGSLPMEEMARRILTAQGPSGANREYLYNLASTMRVIAPNVQDEHLFSLESAVRALERLQDHDRDLRSAA